MADDSYRVQSKLFRLLAQSVTELARLLKYKKQTALLKEDYQAANEMERLQMRIEENPDQYVAVTLYSGSEDEFRDMMEKLGIDYMYANASYLENYTGTYILNREDYQKLLSHIDVRVYKHKEDLMEDAEELEAELHGAKENEEEAKQEGKKEKDEEPSEEDAGQTIPEEEKKKKRLGKEAKASGKTEEGLTEAGESEEDVSIPPIPKPVERRTDTKTPGQISNESVISAAGDGKSFPEDVTLPEETGFVFSELMSDTEEKGPVFSKADHSLPGEKIVPEMQKGHEAAFDKEIIKSEAGRNHQTELDSIEGVSIVPESKNTVSEAGSVRTDVPAKEAPRQTQKEPETPKTVPSTEEIKQNNREKPEAVFQEKTRVLDGAKESQADQEPEQDAAFYFENATHEAVTETPEKQHGETRFPEQYARHQKESYNRPEEHVLQGSIPIAKEKLPQGETAVPERQTGEGMPEYGPEMDTGSAQPGKELWQDREPVIERHSPEELTDAEQIPEAESVSVSQQPELFEPGSGKEPESFARDAVFYQEPAAAVLEPEQDTKESVRFDHGDEEQQSSAVSERSETEAQQQPESSFDREREPFAFSEEQEGKDKEDLQKPMYMEPDPGIPADSSALEERKPEWSGSRFSQSEQEAGHEERSFVQQNPEEQAVRFPEQEQSFDSEFPEQEEAVFVERQESHAWEKRQTAQPSASQPGTEPASFDLHKDREAALEQPDLPFAEKQQELLSDDSAVRYPQERFADQSETLVRGQGAQTVFPEPETVKRTESVLREDGNDRAFHEKFFQNAETAAPESQIGTENAPQTSSRPVYGNESIISTDNSLERAQQRSESYPYTEAADRLPVPEQNEFSWEEEPTGESLQEYPEREMEPEKPFRQERDEPIPESFPQVSVPFGSELVREPDNRAPDIIPEPQRDPEALADAVSPGPEQEYEFSFSPGVEKPTDSLGRESHTASFSEPLKSADVEPVSPSEGWRKDQDPVFQPKPETVPDFVFSPEPEIGSRESHSQTESGLRQFRDSTPLKESRTAVHPEADRPVIPTEISSEKEELYSSQPYVMAADRSSVSEQGDFSQKTEAPAHDSQVPWEQERKIERPFEQRRSTPVPDPLPQDFPGSYSGTVREPDMQAPIGSQEFKRDPDVFAHAAQSAPEREHDFLFSPEPENPASSPNAESRTPTFSEPLEPARTGPVPSAARLHEELQEPVFQPKPETIPEFVFPSEPETRERKSFSQAQNDPQQPRNPGQLKEFHTETRQEEQRSESSAFSFQKESVGMPSRQPENAVPHQKDHAIKSHLDFSPQRAASPEDAPRPYAQDFAHTHENGGRQSGPDTAAILEVPFQKQREADTGEKQSDSFQRTEEQILLNPEAGRAGIDQKQEMDYGLKKTPNPETVPEKGAVHPSYPEPKLLGKRQPEYQEQDSKIGFGQPVSRQIHGPEAFVPVVEQKAMEIPEPPHQETRQEALPEADHRGKQETAPAGSGVPLPGIGRKQNTEDQEPSLYQPFTESKPSGIRQEIVSPSAGESQEKQVSSDLSKHQPFARSAGHNPDSVFVQHRQDPDISTYPGMTPVSPFVQELTGEGESSVRNGQDTNRYQKQEPVRKEQKHFSGTAEIIRQKQEEKPYPDIRKSDSSQKQTPSGPVPGRRKTEDGKAFAVLESGEGPAVRKSQASDGQSIGPESGIKQPAAFQGGKQSGKPLSSGIEKTDTSASFETGMKTEPQNSDVGPEKGSPRLAVNEAADSKEKTKNQSPSYQELVSRIHTTVEKQTGEAGKQEKEVPPKDRPIPLSSGKRRYDDSGMSFEDRIRSSMEADGTIQITVDEMSKDQSFGEHDTFRRAAVEALASPAGRQNHMASRGVREVLDPTRRDAVYSSLRFMADPLRQMTADHLRKGLSKEEQELFADIIKRNGFGTFSLEPDADLDKALEAYGELLRKAGILQGRSYKQGKVLMRIGKNVRKTGTKTEEKLRKEREQVLKTTFVTKTQKERAMDFLRMEFKKSGKVISEKDLEALVDRMFGHAGEVSDTLTLITKMKNSFGRMTRFGLIPGSQGFILNNQMFRKPINADMTGQGYNQFKSIFTVGKLIGEGVPLLAQYAALSQSEKYAKQLVKLDKKLSSARYQSAGARQPLIRQREKLVRKKKRFDTIGDRAEKLYDKVVKTEKSVSDTMKKPFRKLKKSAGDKLKRGFKKIPGNQRIAAKYKLLQRKLSWKVFLEKHQHVSKVFNVLGIGLQKFNAIQQAAIRLLLMLMKWAVAYIIFSIKVALIATVMMIPLICIVSFFTTNTDERDAQTVYESTLGAVYQRLQLMETNWVANIKNSAQEDAADIDEFKYTEINEATGTIDNEHRSMEVSAYIPYKFGTAYRDGKMKGPEPWPEAPQEAYKWIEKIDGGVEVRFLGTGGYPGYSSNVMDIVCMAITAQEHSSLTEVSDESLDSVTSKGFFDSIYEKVTSVGNVLQNAVSGMAQALRNAIPGLDDFLTRYENEKRTLTFMAYCKPLFDKSHEQHYALEVSLLPTMRTILMDGSGEINYFNALSSMGEGLSDASYSTAKALTTAEQETIAKYIWDWMAAHGVKEIQRAAILGNIQGECGMNPGLHEAGKPWNKGGLGLCQWTGSRRQEFEAYMASRGTNWQTDVDGQLEFLFYHDDAYDLGILRQFLAADYTQVAQATRDFGLKWERFAASDTSMDRKRIPYALKYYEMFSGSTVSSNIDTGSESETPAKEYITKYSHTANIDDNGNANGIYGHNLNTTDTVTIPEAESLTVEVWCSTESTSYDWLYVKDKDGNEISEKLGNGRKTQKPADESIYHNIFTIPGDTVQFVFHSDNTKAYYGYYAVIKDSAEYNQTEEEAPVFTQGADYYQKQTVTKYSHTANIEDNGNVKLDEDGNEITYEKNLSTDDVVTIPGADQLKIELWYSTQSVSRDWVEVFDQEGNSVSGKLGGGKSKKKPTQTAYRRTYTVDGNTVKFHFESNRNLQYYGYYAVITAEVVEKNTSEEIQNNINAEQQGSLNQILSNVQICPDDAHGGYGCMSYSGFYYNDTERHYLYYPSMESARIDVVQPAALVDNSDTPCNAPLGTEEQFYKVLDSNPDCWSFEFVESNTYDGEGYETDRGSAVLDDYACDGGGYSAHGNAHQFTVDIVTDIDEDDDYDDEDGWECNCTYTVSTYRVVHDCDGHHTGYYCGGHAKMVVYGMVYHITKAQRENNHLAYQDKTVSIGPYLRDSSLMAILTSRLVKAEDLFDIDMSLVHAEKTVHKDFEGWTYDNMDDAATKLLDDWYDLYGIQANYTIAGINGTSSSSQVVPVGGIADHLLAVKDQIRSTDTANLRLAALERAFTYVGQISYSQAHHGDPLTPGGQNDCSGYASRVWYEVLHRIYNTDSFVTLAKQVGAYRSFTDGNIQPGDIILHGMETSTRADNHALIYVGVENGTTMSIDCSGGGVMYRSRGTSYYNTGTYIDMDVLIRGYLALHPEADVEPDILKYGSQGSGQNSGQGTNTGTGQNSGQNSGQKPGSGSGSGGNQNSGQTSNPGTGSGGSQSSGQNTKPNPDQGTGSGNSGGTGTGNDGIDIDW